MNENFSQDVFENLLASLEEGLKKYEDGINMNDKSFKFAILHINHFVELSFKYFIIQIHPILVYHQPYTDKELEK